MQDYPALLQEYGIVEHLLHIKDEVRWDEHGAVFAVIGEDGATLDITNEIFGDGEGDGKIYDLNGIRVMQPVKGRLYIVNGQKKVYR